MAGEVLPNAESPIRAALRSLDADDLFTLADEVSELKDSRAWEALMRLLDQGRNRVLEHLLRSTLEQAGYAKLTGYISGLETLLAISDEVGKVAQDRRAKIKADADRERAGERATA